MSGEYDLSIYIELAVTWLEYCRYGVKHKTILRTLCGGVVLFRNIECFGQIKSVGKFEIKKKVNQTIGIENTVFLG